MFVHSVEIRREALRLRCEERLAIDDIADRLGVSRSTVYGWVKHLPIERTAKQTAAQHRRSLENSERYRRRREAAYTEGVTCFARLAAEPTFRDFVCMYIGEGSKRNRGNVGICNSDPTVMRLADRWLHRISHKPHAYSIQYHADQDLEELRRFWASQLGIEPGLIKLLRKSNSNQLTGRLWRSAHGVLAIRINDTYARARLQAWMDIVRSEWV